MISNSTSNNKHFQLLLQYTNKNCQKNDGIITGCTFHLRAFKQVYKYSLRCFKPLNFEYSLSCSANLCLVAVNLYDVYTYMYTLARMWGET